MDCPKCGTAQEVDRDECRSCGLIFERWRVAQDRATLLTEQAGAVEFIPAERGVPKWLVVVVVGVAVLLGAAWSVKRREERVKSDPARALMAELDAINAKGSKARGQLQSAVEISRRHQRDARQSRGREAVVVELHWPDGLTDAKALELIERCSGFVQPQTERLPKTFRQAQFHSMLETYPNFRAALETGLVELDPPMSAISRARTVHDDDQTSPMIWVRATAEGMATLGFLDMGDQYEIDLGRRRGDGFMRVYGSDAQARVEFYWTFERPGGEKLRSDHKPQGYVDLMKDGSDWMVRTGEITERARPVRVCP